MFSRRLWMVLALAIAIHAIELYQFDAFEFDKMNHISATASWLAGRGFVIPDVGPGGLPTTAYRPLRGFPPGYALALAPLMRLTHEVWWSAFTLDLAGQLLFLIAWAAVLQSATGSTPRAIELLLLWSVLFSPVAGGTYSDLLAVALFSAAVAAGTIALDRRPGRAWAGGVASAALVALACVVRYAYWPLGVAIPVALLVARRDRTAAALAATHAVIVAAAVGLTALFMRRTTGEAVFLSRWYPNRGFYWSQLSTVWPFPADALGIGRVAGLIAKDHPGLMPVTSLIVWLAALVCVAVAIAYLVNRVRAGIAGRIAHAEAYLVVAGTIACAATVAMNLWLTVRLPSLAGVWTVGSDPRYYLPVLPFVGAAICLAARDRRVAMPRVRPVAIALLLVVIAVTVPLRVIRIKRYLEKNVQTAWMSSGRRAQAATIFSAIRSVEAGDTPPLWVDDSRNWRKYVATMGGALVVTHAAVERCDGPPPANPRFLLSVPSATGARAAASGTPLGVVEDVEILSVTASPCPRSDPGK